VTQPVPGQPIPQKRILVAEDEFILAAELTSVLEKAGYEVIASVGEVQEGLDFLKHERPDAAVLDVNLSDGNVTPVAAVLKSMNVPFVLASALSDREISRNSVLAGTPNLGKPTDAGKLVAAVKALLVSQSASG
jgi:two-component system, response regulator PdtaR